MPHWMKFRADAEELLYILRNQVPANCKDPIYIYIYIYIPSLKLTAKAPENGWLEDDCFLLGRQTAYFHGQLTVSFREGIYFCCFLQTSGRFDERSDKSWLKAIFF